MKKFSAVVVVTVFMIAMLMTGCRRGGDDTSTLLVKVENDDRSRIPNATVVLGDSNGSMIESKTTDSHGEATFSNPPANATVTAAATMSCSTYTDKDIFVRYDVNVSTVTAGLDLCDGRSAAAGVDIINVNITNIPAEATRYHVQWGGRSQYQYGTIISGAGTEQIEVGTHDLQSDGKVSIVVVADDSSYLPMSYGVLTDITPISGMTVTIAANQVFTNTIQYQLNNIPATAKSIIRYIWESRKQKADEWGGVGLYFANLTTTGTSTAISVPYIPDFGDKFEYSAWLELDQNNNGSIDSSARIFRVGDLLEDQTFDMSQVPSIPINLTITGNNTATPTFSWSGGDPSAHVIAINAYTAEYYFYFWASPARTSVTFPELPDTLAAFRPTAITNLYVDSYRYDMFTSYADYESKIERYENGTWIIPAVYTIFGSGGRYSTTQTLAPALSKTAAPSMKTKRTNRFGMPR